MQREEGASKEEELKTMATCPRVALSKSRTQKWEWRMLNIPAMLLQKQDQRMQSFQIQKEIWMGKKPLGKCACLAKESRLVSCALVSISKETGHMKAGVVDPVDSLACFWSEVFQNWWVMSLCDCLFKHLCVNVRVDPEASVLWTVAYNFISYPSRSAALRKQIHFSCGQQCLWNLLEQYHKTIYYLK